MSRDSQLQQDLAALFKRNKGDIKPGLERISEVLELIDNPQQNFLAIHIAGTNSAHPCTPAATTRPRSSAATVTGTTAATSSSSNRANAASAQPSVARQPAARTCTISPVHEVTPRFMQSISPAPIGAGTNRTSSPMLQGSA